MRATPSLVASCCHPQNHGNQIEFRKMDRSRPTEQNSQPAAMADSPFPDERMVFASASGSSTGMDAKIAGFPSVSVLLPAPFAPARTVSVGRFTGLAWQLRTGLERPAFVPAAPQGGDDPQQPLLSLLRPIVVQIPASLRSPKWFTPIQLNASPEPGSFRSFRLGL